MGGLMLIGMHWLGQYVELPEGVTGEQVAADLVSVGLEEEGLSGGDVTGPLVVGRVLEMSAEPQKNGKVINWCQVDVGPHGQRLTDDTSQGIVCGGHNFAVGDLVAVILPGGVLPGDFTISARKTYGHLSAGMICSAQELGLGAEADGIIVLSDYFGVDVAAQMSPGDDLIAAFGLDEEVLEVNVTPDRGYCFSMRGIAREYSHATGARYTDPAAIDVDAATSGGFEVELRDDAPIRGAVGCARYVARIVRGVDVSATTPRWMAQRLTSAGMRPISLAVDVTNYVMLTLGQPLHAFDLATLQAPIVVRRARPGETLVTLDDVERTLHTEDLLITHGTHADSVLALAGVMGGESSEVSSSTTDVLIESANFEARGVGRTARRHRLPREAAKRFERGVDPALGAVAAQMAADLLVRWGAGTYDPEVTDVDQRQAATPITFDLALPSAYVGYPYGFGRVIEVLQDIGCQVTALGTGKVEVIPASWRPDLIDAPSLVEEVARIVGYDHIPSIVPGATGGSGLTQHQRLRRSVSRALAGQGLNEVLTYPFVGERRFDELGLSADDPRRMAIALANPLSDEAPLMRTELLQTLPEALRRNVSRGFRDVALFEIDTVTRAASHAAPVPAGAQLPQVDVLDRMRSAVPAQPWHGAMIASGHGERPGWWGGGRKVVASDAVAWARSVAEAAGCRDVELVSDVRMPWHPGRCVRLTVPVTGVGNDADAHPDAHREADPAVDAVPGRHVFGWAGELHPQVITALGLPPRTVAAEVDLDVLAVATSGRVVAQPISTHPVATSDVAVMADRGVSNAAVLSSLREGAGSTLESIELFDVYQGDQIEAAHKSLAFRLTFRAPDRTLRTEEVNVARDAALARAAADHGVSQRG
ncbi:MAG: phenylalanine--tRNA ligase subunit beta [Ornithinimicrobium sp.]